MSNPTHAADRANQILNEEMENWQRLRDAAADKDPWDPEVWAADIRKWHQMQELAADNALATDELVRRARETGDPDRAWDYVQILHWRGIREVLEAAHRLSQDPTPGARGLAADILGQLGGETHPFPTEAGDILLATLATETDPAVLRDIGLAFSHLHDPRALEPLLALQQHADPEVRLGVAHGLGSVEDPRAILALITLSRDSDPHVREWATFGLGLHVVYDEENGTPPVREALLMRVTDENYDTREEALLALAELGDERVVEPLIQELQSETFTNRLMWAVKNLANPRFCAGLQEVRAWWPDPAEVDRALQACDCLSH